MKKILSYGTAALAATLLSGCAGAAFNRVEMQVVRNVSVGQELIKLQEAHEKGIINDTEYAEAKQAAMKLLSDYSDVDVNMN